MIFWRERGAAPCPVLGYPARHPDLGGTPLSPSLGLTFFPSALPFFSWSATSLCHTPPPIPISPLSLFCFFCFSFASNHDEQHQVFQKLRSVVDDPEKVQYSERQLVMLDNWCEDPHVYMKGDVFDANHFDVIKIAEYSVARRITMTDDAFEKLLLGSNGFFNQHLLGNRSDLMLMFTAMNMKELGSVDINKIVETCYTHSKAAFHKLLFCLSMAHDVDESECIPITTKMLAYLKAEVDTLSHRTIINFLHPKTDKALQKANMFAKVCMVLAQHSEDLRVGASVEVKNNVLYHSVRYDPILFPNQEECWTCTEKYTEKSWVTYFHLDAKSNIAHIACRECARKCLQKDHRCPLCREDLEHCVMPDMPLNLDSSFELAWEGTDAPHEQRQRAVQRAKLLEAAYADSDDDVDARRYGYESDEF